MELLDDREYLEPLDNEAKVASQCYFCDADIYEGDDYYVLNGFDCCVNCLDIHFKFTAEKHGVEQNFFFLTTFKRYQVQIGILNDLEKTIREEGTLVTKEYVKGRKNVYSHPAISDYNRTTDSANKTVVTLMKIITTLRDHQGDDEPDPLLEILSGRSVKID